MTNLNGTDPEAVARLREQIARSVAEYEAKTGTKVGQDA